jgi:hypothetical protein
MRPDVLMTMRVDDGPVSRTWFPHPTGGDTWDVVDVLEAVAHMKSLLESEDAGPLRARVVVENNYARADVDGRAGWGQILFEPIAPAVVAAFARAR